MCGIAGKFNFDPASPIDRDRLTAMTVGRRAPRPRRGRLLSSARGIGLGHRRLSIIDLSTGDQPLANEDGPIWVVFNGEIYNFAEMRARARGARPSVPHAHATPKSSSTPTSSGASARSTASAACSPSRSGTSRRRRLLLGPRSRSASSRSTTAPRPSGVTFGSEIKSLLEDPDVPRGWSAEALDAYLTLQYVPCPQTIYRAIWKLPPGHLLVAEGGQRRRRGATGTCTFTGDGDAARETRYLERLDALVGESVAAASGQRRAARRVPLGRHRLEPGRRGDGRGVRRRAS